MNGGFCKVMRPPSIYYNNISNSNCNSVDYLSGCRVPGTMMDCYSQPIYQETVSLQNLLDTNNERTNISTSFVSPSWSTTLLTPSAAHQSQFTSTTSDASLLSSAWYQDNASGISTASTTAVPAHLHWPPSYDNEDKGDLLSLRLLSSSPSSDASSLATDWSSPSGDDAIVDIIDSLFTDWASTSSKRQRNSTSSNLSVSPGYCSSESPTSIFNESVESPFALLSESHPHLISPSVTINQSNWNNTCLTSLASTPQSAETLTRDISSDTLLKSCNKQPPSYEHAMHVQRNCLDVTSREEIKNELSAEGLLCSLYVYILMKAFKVVHTRKSQPNTQNGNL